MHANHKTLLLTVTGILSVLACGSAAADSQPDVSGKYQCTYHDPTATPNDGNEVLVLKKTGDLYKASNYGIGNVTPYASGYGLFNKNVNSGMTFLLWVPSTPQYTTVYSANIGTDGSLDVIFAASNTNQSGTLKCTKAPAS